MKQSVLVTTLTRDDFLCFKCDSLLVSQRAHKRRVVDQWRTVLSRHIESSRRENKLRAVCLYCLLRLSLFLRSRGCRCKPYVSLLFGVTIIVFLFVVSPPRWIEPSFGVKHIHRWHSCLHSFTNERNLIGRHTQQGGDDAIP